MRSRRIPARADAHFDEAFPAGLVIGAEAAEVSGPTLLLTSAGAVRAFLPQGGPPGSLASDATDPFSSGAGVLAGQAVALTLNVGFDAVDPDFSPSCVPLANLVVAELTSPCAGWSVRHVLDQAHAILAGAAAPVSPEEIDACVADVNASFLGGSFASGFLTYPDACGPRHGSWSRGPCPGCRTGRSTAR